ncbi:C4-dicarboxylate-binding protein DctP [Alkalispirochaeta americana]|uniref:C4-dicarboxylate-binding protein DctP n=1 Tax=Alkalispirochaeta americana TaxID=159291 RepID=A0A1N6Q5T5_9SPIO|nr:TRAP transporter substrate-binding protein DctP [Alkalispirochaeta americana]SIQ11922.1 C4-dicarboxylate-binding protein DctP [Alkalispirochaeta americana]
MVRTARTLSPGRILLVLIIQALFWNGPTLSARTPRQFRISLENAPSHVQVLAVQEFARRLRNETEGAIAAEVFPSGELFRDSDVVEALHRGALEMGVPGTWQLDRFVPDVAVFLLPEFFGRDLAVVHHHADGPLGAAINRRLEARLPVVVPGRWFDLGHGHLFFRQGPVQNYADLQGQVIRVAGGLANELRIAELGAQPVTIAWGEVPRRLERGQMDGLLTTFETVRSGRLWERGVQFALEDFQYMPQYIPLVSRRVWESFTAEEQDLFRTLWEEEVQKQRRAAAEAQEAARRELVRQGVRIHRVNHDEQERARRLLLEAQPDFVRRLGIDPALLEILQESPRGPDRSRMP